MSKNTDVRSSSFDLRNQRNLKLIFCYKSTSAKPIPTRLLLHISFRLKMPFNDRVCSFAPETKCISFSLINELKLSVIICLI